MTIPTGRFVWFEYVSQDAKKAQGLFGELFGWSTKTVPMPDGEYTMIAAPDGKTIGGYFASPDPSSKQAFWLPYLQVQNAADSAAKVTKAGGAVMKPPFKVGDLATMAVVADPHGGGFALWQPVKPEDAGPPAAGHFCWNELASKDADASVAFYTQIGGFTHSQMDMGGMGTYHLLESDGKSRAGIMAQASPEQPHAWLPYVQVASADQTADKAVRLGLTIVVPPTQIPNVGRFAILVDGQGAGTGILQP
ncbi:MAG TPA: VOC family protein [Kofleriaceae bacterium]|nr:VOC family protein [Kofleriaceae bacterium]